ncbi:MAG: CarD family transcriptional regulator [Bacilli bacterium]|nr:CarD family transcriptional regulator [Bacilli bacterium]
MFKVGEYIIYKRDLCKIKNIEKSSRTNEDYYTLYPIQDESLSIKVPVSNKFNNLRYPLSKQEAEDLIAKIPNIPPIKTSDKLLENTYRELMKTNTHEDLIKIIKTTYIRNQARLNQGKKAGDKDQTFFNQAEKYLYNELSYSLSKTYDECKDYIIKKVTQTKEKSVDND